MVGVSSSTRARFDAVPGWRGDNFALIHNGVDPARFGPDAATSGARERLFPGAAADDVLVVCASQVVPAKGMTELVDAVALTPPKVRVAVLGHGEPAYVASLEQRARERGVGERIRFAGFTEHVERLLPAADLFTLPSYAEGMPLAVLEAMASGLAVVGTDVAGTCELVSPETGVLVPSHDGAALGRAIADLAGDADRRRALGAAGRRVVEASFTLGRYVERFEALLGDLAVPQRT
jgi:glycosyltransferase involved in cell wall biosynthesis